MFNWAFFMKQKVIGTYCFNCLYISKKEENVDQTELNDQGGIDPKTDGDMQKAQKADLITLPGGFKSDVTGKRYCSNQSVEMFVTERMCCAYWDNEGVRRPWKKIDEPQYIDQFIG
jgi:hypothetical protein